MRSGLSEHPRMGALRLPIQFNNDTTGLNSRAKPRPVTKEGQSHRLRSQFSSITATNTTAPMSRAKPRPTTHYISIPQNSPLLNLPAELRNMIYELAAQNETVVPVWPRTQSAQRRSRYCGSLGLVCWQIHCEYQPFYSGAAIFHAARVEIRTIDYVGAHMQWFVPKILEPYRYIHGKIVLRCYLTNVWDPTVSLRRGKSAALQDNGLAIAAGNLAGVDIPYEFKIEFDPKNFDMERCRSAVERLDCYIGRPSQPADMHCVWPKLREAVYDAFGGRDEEVLGRTRRK